MTSTEAVLDHHLEAFETQDLEAIMADYADESTLITNMGTFRGREEIEGLFKDLFIEFDDPDTSITMDKRLVEGEFGYIVWHAETPDNEYAFATDTFYIPDGEITFQSFAGQINPKG